MRLIVIVPAHPWFSHRCCPGERGYSGPRAEQQSTELIPAMKVNLEKTFPMPVPPAFAWRFLQNIESVAACMPGAKITERVDDTNYKGEVTARVGPATLSFTGTIEVLDVDPATMTLRMLGKGTDRSGSSGASMDLTARIELADDGKSNLIGNSTVTMSGKAATFGGRMMVPVADQILKQFAGNFATRVQEAESQAQPGRVSQAAGEGSAAPDTSLNALALIWAVIKDTLRRLVGAKGS
jgi:carbon monoxide dehydrogenase subunit G